jgi:hypothetical protein
MLKQVDFYRLSLPHLSFNSSSDVSTPSSTNERALYIFGKAKGYDGDDEGGGGREPVTPLPNPNRKVQTRDLIPISFKIASPETHEKKLSSIRFKYVVLLSTTIAVACLLWRVSKSANYFNLKNI